MTIILTAEGVTAICAVLALCVGGAAKYVLWAVERAINRAPFVTEKSCKEKRKVLAIAAGIPLEVLRNGD